MDTFDPTAIATVGHNQSPFDAIKREIEDLFDTAKSFADGEPIDSPELAAVITELHDRIHECGKRAEDLRVAEKKPIDDQIAAIQSKFYPLIGNTKAGKGKVVLGKEACQELLTPWRTRVAAEKAAEAAAIALAAAEATRIATAAIHASSGNLAAREEAEELLADAKKLEKTAKRADKAATVGTGLRTVWDVTLVDEEAAMDWLWARAKAEVLAVAQKNAEEQVRAGVRSVPGFSVVERKVAA
ncbi:hypothetical protein [Rhizobium leguminosarum]|uniref:hypothetical protein n=1 Tax=Rhizobium leguminosarum TaxID=384 RepID=UPI0015DBA6A9|nr:hypothetical protein [Rhizobium leguminosarum]NZD50517.1 hypothetical protein [Rhizobium leguminosarum]